MTPDPKPLPRAPGAEPARPAPPGGVSRDKERDFRVVKLATKCATTSEFVGLFHPFVDEESIVIPGGRDVAVGTVCRFEIALKDGMPVMRGRCQVVETGVGRGGKSAKAFRAKILEMDAGTKLVFRRLLDARETRRTHVPLLLTNKPPVDKTPAPVTVAPPAPLTPASKPLPSSASRSAAGPLASAKPLTPVLGGGRPTLSLGAKPPALAVPAQGPTVTPRDRTARFYPPATREPLATPQTTPPSSGGFDAERTAPGEPSPETLRKGGAAAPGARDPSAPHERPTTEAAAEFDDDKTPIPGEPALSASAAELRTAARPPTAPVAASGTPGPALRAPGASFKLPANPFSELTAESLASFIECTLYEEGEETPLPDLESNAMPVAAASAPEPAPQAAAPPTVAPAAPAVASFPEPAPAPVVSLFPVGGPVFSAEGKPLSPPGATRPLPLETPASGFLPDTGAPAAAAPIPDESPALALPPSPVRAAVDRALAVIPPRARRHVVKVAPFAATSALSILIGYLLHAPTPPPAPVAVSPPPAVAALQAPPPTAAPARPPAAAAPAPAQAAPPAAAPTPELAAEREPDVSPPVRAHGQLRVTSNPPGALLAMDKWKLGRTPRTLDVIKGERVTLVARRPGSPPQTRTLILDEDQNEVHFDFLATRKAPAAPRAAVARPAPAPVAKAAAPKPLKTSLARTGKARARKAAAADDDAFLDELPPSRPVAAAKDAPKR